MKNNNFFFFFFRQNIINDQTVSISICQNWNQVLKGTRLSRTSEGSCWTGRRERKGLVGTLSSGQRDWPGPLRSSCAAASASLFDLSNASSCHSRRWSSSQMGRDGGARTEAWCHFNRSHWLPKMSQRYSPLLPLLFCISGGRARARLSAFPFS